MTNKINFVLEDAEYVPLCHLLKYVAVADSGGQAKALIAAGKVLRNGVVETRKTAKIHAGEKIAYAGVMISVQSRPQPPGTVETSHDE